MQLRDALLLERAWRGSMDELAEKASMLCREYAVVDGIHLPETTRAVIINYRTCHILPPAAGKLFSWEHLVRLLSARYLLAQGWKRNEVALHLRGQPAEYLATHLGASPSGPETCGRVTDAVTARQLEQASLAISLLAAGIVEEYARARCGKVLVHDSGLSAPLVQALHMFAGLFLERGQDNALGSVHDLLARCQQPLTEASFGLDLFSHPDFPYKGLVLIDPDHRIPTLDCSELAGQGSSELDLREQLAFKALREASGQFVEREADVYSALRLWIVEHPVTTRDALRAFMREEGLQLAASFLSACYEPLGPQHLVGGELHLCQACGAPMRRSLGVPHLYACAIRQCRKFDTPVRSVARTVGTDMIVATAAIVLYWVGPGLDEAAIYRHAIKYRCQARVYPDQDTCDISLDGDAIGIDVKSHANPHVLIARLNRSSGGLAFYPKRIVAINDRALARWHGYLEVLTQGYTGPVALQFMSVRELMKSMEIPF